MKNNFLVVVLVILIGVLSGIALLVGISSTVQVAMSPVAARLTQIETNQKIILSKISSSGSGDSQIGQQLTVLSNQLKALEAKIGAGAPPMPSMPQPPQEDFNKVYDIDISNSPIAGKKDAPITIIDFVDFQCPFCARFYPAIKEVLKAYPDQVKVVIKNFPLSFHPNAKPAAKMALAANEQGKYFEMADLLMQNGADVSEAKVKDYAKELKLNYKQLMNDLKNKDAQYEALIAEDMALAQRVDVQGTPTFFLNGKKTSARDFAGYKTEIDQILGR